MLGSGVGHTSAADRSALPVSLFYNPRPKVLSAACSELDATEERNKQQELLNLLAVQRVGPGAALVRVAQDGESLIARVASALTETCIAYSNCTTAHQEQQLEAAAQTHLVPECCSFEPH